MHSEQRGSMKTGSPRGPQVCIRVAGWPPAISGLRFPVCKCTPHPTPPGGSEIRFVDHEYKGIRPALADFHQPVSIRSLTAVPQE